MSESTIQEGDVLDSRYAIIETIGHGGMGSVYRARHVISQREVALKVLHPEVSRNPSTMERFRREASATSRFHHEGLVEVYDAGQDAQTGLLYIAMELLHGEELGDWLASDDANLMDGLKLICRLLEPLGVLHEAGLVHRDLKPNNIFLHHTPSGNLQVKLLDFGIARVRDATTVTQTGISLGTPRYMAPEQLTEAKEATAAADVWAIGVLLYELLGGEHPFEAPSPQATVVNACVVDHKPLTTLIPEIPAELSTLVDGCLVKEPGNRIADAASLWKKLQAIVDVDEENENQASFEGYLSHSGEMVRQAPRDDSMDQTQQWTSQRPPPNSDAKSPLRSLPAPALVASQTPAQDNAPFNFGPRYEVMAFIGRGGMGSVYRVLDKELEEEVALKTLHEELMEHPRAAVRFRREVKLARRVTHPNVARIYDIRAENTPMFLTMEFVDGTALSDHIAKAGRLDPQEVIEIGIQICQALIAAHRAQVVHRDLKPENVLIDKTGRVVVTDFGIAISSANDTSGGTRSRVLGTPYYIAPEQAKGERVDGRADIYALGVMLFQMLSGQRPWTGDSPRAIMLQRFTKAPPPLPRDIEAPAALEQIVQRAMALKPDARFQNAEHVVSALRRLSSNSELVRLSETGTSPTNLTQPDNPFIGREKESKALSEALMSHQRLITLRGPGGIGKTRLAQQYGLENLDHYPGGVWFCDLSDAKNANEICEAVSRGMDLAIHGGDPIERLGEGMRDRGRLLLILDNAERAIAPTAGIAARWLKLTPNVQVVVTSRLRLGIATESVMTLDPLTHEDAMHLFAQRAREVRTEFRITKENRSYVEAIVERVDRMALAVELAAARIRMMTPQRLLERLEGKMSVLRSNRRNQEAREGTLHQVLEGSWELLSPAAQLAFAQCSVFRNGASLDAICSVLDLSHIDAEVWPEETIEELWDHSLIKWERDDAEERLRMLETVRDFGAEKLSDPKAIKNTEERSLTGLPEYKRMRNRHAEHFASFGKSHALRRLNQHGGVERWRQLERELDNLQAACDWACGRGNQELAIACLRAAHTVFEVQGPHEVAIGLAEKVLAMNDLSSESEMWAQDIAGIACQHAGRFQHAQKHLIRALRLVTELGDRQAEGIVLSHLGEVHEKRGDLVNAKQLMLRAVNIHRQMRDRAFEGHALGHLGMVEGAMGNLDNALELYNAALAIARQVGSQREEGLWLGNIGIVHRRREINDEAKTHLEEALEADRNVGNRRREAVWMGNLAGVCQRMGDHARAIELLENAIRLHREVGNREGQGISYGWLGHFQAQRAKPKRAADAFREGERLLRTVRSRFQLAELLCKKGIFWAKQNSPDAARKALNEAKTLIGTPKGTGKTEYGKFLRELERLV